MTQITRTLGLAALLLMPALQAGAQEPAAAPTEPPPGAPPPPAAAPAPSGSPTSFGAPGQLVIAVDVGFLPEGPQLAIAHESVSMGGSGTTAIAIQPSLDYFLAPNISVGGQLGISHGSADNSGYSGSATVIGVEARGGYNIALMESLSLWPRLGIAYNHESFSVGSTDQSGYTLALRISVPVLWHPSSHFFIGAGPAFSTELLSKVEGVDQGKATDIGLTALIGGYFGGA